MASNVGRWLKYAKAKLDDTLSSAHKELDELEAERAARTADQPWITAEGDAPTLDEVRAKIEARSASASAPTMPEVTTTPDGEPVRPSSWDVSATPEPTTAEPAADGAGPPSTDGADQAEGAPPSTAESSGRGDDLRTVAEAAAQSQAKLELEARAREAAERLEQIRRELGVDSPPDAAP